MSSIESPELKTADAHSQELTTALSTDPVCVAGALVNKKFIQDGVMLEMLTKGDTPTKKATILVEAVSIDNRGGRRDWKRAYRSVVTSRRMIDTARPFLVMSMAICLSTI